MKKKTPPLKARQSKKYPSGGRKSKQESIQSFSTLKKPKEHLCYDSISLSLAKTILKNDSYGSIHLKYITK